MVDSFTLVVSRYERLVDECRSGAASPNERESLPPSLSGCREGTSQPSCSLVLVFVGFFSWKPFSLLAQSAFQDQQKQYSVSNFFVNQDALRTRSSSL